MSRIRACLLGSIALLLCSCAHDESTGQNAPRLASLLPDSWRVSISERGGLPVVSAAPLTESGDGPVSGGFSFSILYIEGDGYAWRTRSTPSHDPTPINPMALKLALTDDRAPVAYLARPCQFEARTSPACEPAVWTGARYSEAALQAMSAAIDDMNENRNPLILVGYSGGGVMASLLAIRRDDVLGFITIAANLDTDFWTRHHGVSPLTESLAPLDYAEALAPVPQVHLIGGADKTVPSTVISSYLAGLKLDTESHVIKKATFDHQCCWVDDWRQLQQEAMSLLRSQIQIADENRQ